jgi:16S rRNA (guanine527-N7)-methyltransferase
MSTIPSGNAPGERILPGKVETLLRSGANEVGVQLNPHMLKMLLIYFNELKEWNQKLNLTSLQNDRDIIIDHFVDSLSVVPYLPKSGNLLDIGSGAGFPGLPIKIARPELEITLLESKRKKINFLKQVILLLNLSCTTVLHGRIEKLASKKGCGIFDMVIARAFAPLETVLKLAHPWLKKGGHLIAMKGKEGDEELVSAQPLLSSLSMTMATTVELQLPETHKKRVLFFIVKL